MPAQHKVASRSLAIDWTDHETWSRPRAKNDPGPANDPDASWGHAKRNAPGAKDHLFFGYYAQVATMVKDDRDGPPVPELVRRIAFAPPRDDPAALMASVLVSAGEEGLLLKDVLCDCGYSNRDPQSFARPLRDAGARLVMDLHPNDRGPRGTFEGAVICNGQLYCPMTPPGLLRLGPLSRGAELDQAVDHDRKCEELARYRFSIVTAPDGEGYQRFSCPAATGKCRCVLRPTSLALSHDHPSVLGSPGHEERCCRQQTITVPPQVNEKTRQALAYPSAAHRDSYGRRTAADAPMPPWPTPRPGASAGAGAACSVARRTPSCTPSPSWCETCGSPSPSKPKELTKLAAPPSDHASAIEVTGPLGRAGRPAPYRGPRPPCLEAPLRVRGRRHKKIGSDR